MIDTQNHVIINDDLPGRFICSYEYPWQVFCVALGFMHYRSEFAYHPHAVALSGSVHNPAGERLRVAMCLICGIRFATSQFGEID